MKDYRLSEIKVICENTGFDCDQCEFFDQCEDMFGNSIPNVWDIDEPIKTPSKDDIILAVKQTIGSLGTLDEMTETLTLDCSDIDHIAEMIAEKFCGGKE